MDTFSLRTSTPAGTITPSSAPDPGPDPIPAHGLRGVITRHPVASFLTVSLGVAYPALIGSLVAGAPLMPAKALQMVLMLGLATLITAWTTGRSGVRALFGGLTRWRIGTVRWITVVAAMPVLTLLVAAATGTVDTPAHGWAGVAGFWALVFAFSLLTGNLWEETAWAGFVQNRLMCARGLVAGSLLTAIPFALIHLPLAFENHGLHGTSMADAITDWVFLVTMAPVLRYLIGMLLTDTGGSTLAAAVVHASFNASIAMTVLAGGGWQTLPALFVLMLVVAIVRGRTAVAGTAAVATAAA